MPGWAEAPAGRSRTEAIQAASGGGQSRAASPPTVHGFDDVRTPKDRCAQTLSSRTFLDTCDAHDKEAMEVAKAVSIVRALEEDDVMAEAHKVLVVVSVIAALDDAAAVSEPEGVVAR